MIKILFFNVLLFLITNCYSQSPPIQWQKSLGGSMEEVGFYVEVTSDGGYIVTGSSRSNNGDVVGHHGATSTFDCWVVKLDNTGTVEWKKSLGGTGNDYSLCIKQTSDGGYILSGTSYSNDGDVTGHHGALTTGDAWLVKLDTAGTIQWQKSLGGTLDEFGYVVKETSDGNFILISQAKSDDGDVSVHYGSFAASDIWICKISFVGAIIWQKSLGGTSLENGWDIIQTNDEGFALIGTTYSNDIDVSGNHGDKDGWIVKLDSMGIIEWQKCFGGALPDQLVSIKQTSDNGFILVGNTYSTDGDLLGIFAPGLEDAWIIKIDSVGIILWTKRIGGSQYEYARSVEVDPDGGYIVGSISSSNNFDLTLHYGDSTKADFWMSKLDTSGNIQWQQTYGGTLDDDMRYAKPTPDGGFICIGGSQSNDFDATINNGNMDYWVVKLGAFVGMNEQYQNNLLVFVYPNPSLGEFNFCGLKDENTIEILDISGRVIKKESSKNNSHTIDLNGSANGLYFYKVTNNNNISQTGKIVLQ